MCQRRVGAEAELQPCADEIAERERRTREEDSDAFTTEDHSGDDDEDEEEWDEFRCEQMLRESDMLSENTAGSWKNMLIIPTRSA